MLGQLVLKQVSMITTVLMALKRKPSLARRSSTRARSSSTTQAMIMVVFNLTRSKTRRTIVSEASMTLITTERPIRSYKTLPMALLNKSLTHSPVTSNMAAMVLLRILILTSIHHQRVRDLEVKPKVASGVERTAAIKVLGGEMPSKAPRRKLVSSLLTPRKD